MATAMEGAVPAVVATAGAVPAVAATAGEAMVKVAVGLATQQSCKLPHYRTVGTSA